MIVCFCWQQQTSMWLITLLLLPIPTSSLFVRELVLAFLDIVMLFCLRILWSGWKSTRAQNIAPCLYVHHTKKENHHSTPTKECKHLPQPIKVSQPQRTLIWNQPMIVHFNDFMLMEKLWSTFPCTCDWCDILFCHIAFQRMMSMSMILCWMIYTHCCACIFQHACHHLMCRCDWQLEQKSQAYLQCKINVLLCNWENIHAIADHNLRCVCSLLCTQMEITHTECFIKPNFSFVCTLEAVEESIHVWINATKIIWICSLHFDALQPSCSMIHLCHWRWWHLIVIWFVVGADVSIAVCFCVDMCAIANMHSLRFVFVMCCSFLLWHVIDDLFCTHLFVCLGC